MEADFQICPRTGASECHCKKQLSSSNLGNALLSNVKLTLEKLFDDHTFGTTELIDNSLPELNEGAAAATSRKILKNPGDIARALEPIIGNDSATALEEVFTKHLKLAAATLPLALVKETKKLQAAATKFIKQGDEVAAVISSINPRIIPLETAKQEMNTHNNFVVKLVTLRSQGKYREYVSLIDRYTNYAMHLANTIYLGLILSPE